MTRIAIIGGGPGGLMTAYLTERKYGGSCQATLFEATDRIGMEMFSRALRERLTKTDIKLNAHVARVKKNREGGYRVHYRRGREIMTQDFDVIIIALPHNRLSTIEWGGERLRLAMAAVNAQPNGLPLRDPKSAHIPDWAEHPGIFITGDYLFDSTLNGVFDSANLATELIRSRMPKRQPLARSQRASIYQSLIIALLILLHIPGSISAQEVKVDESEPARITFGVETDFNSRYVFRGFAYSQGPVKQSRAWVTVYGFTFYGWSNVMLTNEPQQESFSEADFGVSYAREWKKLIIEPAFDCYLYRSPALANSPPTGEASLKLSYRIGPARVFTKQILDVGSYRGAYFGAAGLAYERKLDRKTMVATTISLGWASTKFNDAYAGVPKRAFNLIGAEVSLTYAPNHRFYLRPHFEFTRVADSQLRRRLDSPTIGNFGLALGFNLN